MLDVYTTMRRNQSSHPEDASQEDALNELIALELMRQESVSKSYNFV